MATYQIGFTGTPNNSIYANAAYVTIALASGSVVAAASGSCTKMFVWKDTASDDVEVEVGIYSDNAGDLDALLVSATKSTGWSAGWNEITIDSTTITSGETYYPAILMVSGSGVIGYDTTSGNVCEKVNTISSLPDPWPSAPTQNFAFGVYLEYEDVSGLSIPVAMMLRRQNGN